MKCTNCGVENPSGNLFCGKCGLPFSAPDQVSQPEIVRAKPDHNLYLWGKKIPTLLAGGVLAVCGICMCVSLAIGTLSNGTTTSQRLTATVMVEGKPTSRQTEIPAVAIVPTSLPTPTNTQVVSRPTSAPSPTSAPTNIAIKTNTPKPMPSNTPRPAVPSVPSFGSGKKIVGADIPAGTYRSKGGSGCYWERLSGFSGTLENIIANDNAVGPTIVTIAPTDKGFNSVRCATWTQDLSPITSNPNAAFGDGTFLVNKDIAPGRWRSTGGTSCYWARLNGFGGVLDNIIANENEKGSAIVEISGGDIGFTSTKCGTWTKIN